MEQQAKTALGIASLLIGLLLGINTMVAEEPNNNWLAWSLVFLGGAFLFWLWLRRDARSAQDAAEQALTSASDEVKRLEASSQSAIGTPPESPQPVEVAAEESAIATPQPQTEAAQPEAAVESDAVDTTVVAQEEREAEEIVQAAYEGDPIAEAEIADASASPPATEADVEVPPVDAPDDDLLRIEGIGPAYRDYLLAAGIDTYEKLAALSEDEIVDLVQEQGGRRRASMSTWAEQAKLAAAHDWDALDQLQEELSGGRR